MLNRSFGYDVRLGRRTVNASDRCDGEPRTPRQQNSSAAHILRRGHLNRLDQAANRAVGKDEGPSIALDDLLRNSEAQAGTGS
jgi:hypothetical protein